MDPEPRHHGNLRDPIDHRDIPHFSVEEVQRLTSDQVLTASEGKERYILPNLPPIYKRLGIGSCTANAVASCLSYTWKKSTGLAYEQFQPSRLWIYYHARTSIDPEILSEKVQTFSDIVKTDTGSHIRSAIHSLLTQGTCTEALWPYGTPLSSNDTDLFLDIDQPPNPCEPSDWSVEKSQAAESNSPDPLDPSDDATTIPREINYYRIFDPVATTNIDPGTHLSASAWHMLYNQTPRGLAGTDSS